NFLLTFVIFKKNLKRFFIVFASSNIISRKKKDNKLRYPNHYSLLNSNIKLKWVKEFDKFVINYVTFIDFTCNTFRSSSKLIKIFTKHTDCVQSINYLIFDDFQFICSKSKNKAVRAWNINNKKKIYSTDIQIM
ncbi:hypothetical protein RFI_38258, partial [Reticulomyxa filosa]